MTIKEIFSIAVTEKASDVHLLVGYVPMLRIDGHLLEMPGSKKVLEEKEIEVLIDSMLTAEQRFAFIKDRNLDFGYQLADGSRYRVNVFFEKKNRGLVARLISDIIPDIKALGLPPVVLDILNLRQGLILVTGPTGSGKSTTLAAMINHINLNRRANIITLEDPIEYVFQPKKSMFMQRQLGDDMISFADGLKCAMRQDPNVIMVGEMRDLESMAATVTLAETGHLVFATLHTYSAAQTIDRIIDIFPPYQQNQVRMQLSASLACVISQRLLPKNGVDGRVAVRELLINTPAVANMIRENKIPQIKSIIETNSKIGMQTMDQNLLLLLKQGLITRDVAMNYAENPETLKA
ncbi:MAG: type IV pilus twitching motility protein PilT [bacterium]